MPQKSIPQQIIEVSVLHNDLKNHSRILVREIVRVIPLPDSKVEVIVEDLSGNHLAYPGLDWARPYTGAVKRERNRRSKEVAKATVVTLLKPIA